MRMFVLHRRREDDQIGVRRHHQIVAADVGGVRTQSCLDHLRAIDRDDARRGHRRRAASAIDPPMSPKPTIAMRANGGSSASPSVSAIIDRPVRILTARGPHFSMRLGPHPQARPLARSAAAEGSHSLSLGASRRARAAGAVRPCTCTCPCTFSLVYTPHPLRATGSRQMLRPIAGAMMRSSAISRSNCAGNSDCAPSLSA